VPIDDPKWCQCKMFPLPPDKLNKAVNVYSKIVVQHMVVTRWNTTVTCNAHITFRQKYYVDCGCFEQQEALNILVTLILFIKTLFLYFPRKTKYDLWSITTIKING